MTSSDWQPDMFLFLLLSVEKAAWHTCQVPHPVPLLCGGLVLYQHRVSSQLPSVARGKEQDDYRYVNQFDSIALIQLWTGFFWLICYQFPETFSAPVFTNGRDKSGFSLGCSRNLTEVFGDRAKYWMLPVFSRWADCERNADLYHTNHDITGYFWGSVLLFVFKWWSVCLLKQHAEFKSTSCSSKLWRSQLKLRLDFSSLQSGRWTFLCHQTGAHRSWASKQCPPAKR